MSVGTMLRPLVDAYAACVPELASRLRAARLNAQSSDEALAGLPPLRKSELAALQSTRPPWGGMLADGWVPSAAFMSSGGVVEPLVPRMVDRLAELLSESGFGPGHVVLNGFGYHVTPAGLLFHEALVRAGCTVLPGGPQNTATLVEYAQLLGANAFVGIASHLAILFEHEPSLAIRLAMAGAEPHGDAVRATLAQRHGVRCVDMYGFAEAGILAASCAEVGALHLHADVRAEVLDAETGVEVSYGDEGELVISLDNPGFPLLRFASGDRVRVDPGRCACGRTGSLQVLGRVDASVRVKGMLLHLGQLRRFALAVGASGCRVTVTRQGDRDHLALAVCLGAAPPPAAAELETAFREAARLRADAIDIDSALDAGSFAFVDQRAAG